MNLKNTNNRLKLYGNMEEIKYLSAHGRMNKECRTQPRSSLVSGS